MSTPFALTALTGIVVLSTVASVAGTAGRQDQNRPPEQPAEQVYKNIQVFKGLPQSQLLSAMFFMEASLNTGCGHCHDTDHFENDAKAAKQAARKMILMVRQLNKLQFAGKMLISCNTCHRGHITPVAPLPFAAVEDVGPKPAASVAGAGDLPAADRLFARHLQAVGGEAALRKIDSRVMKGIRSSSEGWSAPVEISQKAPNMWMSSFKLQAQFVEAFDGVHGWNQDDQGVHDAKPKDLAQLKQDGEFFRDLRLKEMFGNARTVGTATINGHTAYVVEAKSVEGDQKDLYFDVGTGFLIRIVGLDPSPFGPLADAVDYEDYRDVDGIKLPFRISRLRPEFSMIDTFTEIHQNVPIAESKFHKPRTSEESGGPPLDAAEVVALKRDDSSELRRTSVRSRVLPRHPYANRLVLAERASRAPRVRGRRDMPAKIEHVVVLMVENRSFDHMLGALGAENPAIDGIPTGWANPDPNGVAVPAAPLAEYQEQLDPDPDHHFVAVDKQIFNGDTSGSRQVTMQGFVKSYFDQQQNLTQAGKILYYSRRTSYPSSRRSRESS